jgi:hypothetical protein
MSKIDFNLSKIPSFISLTLNGWDGVLIGAGNFEEFVDEVYNSIIRDER